MPNLFPDKNQKPLRMCRMQITKQAVAILSLISGNVFGGFTGIHAFLYYFYHGVHINS